MGLASRIPRRIGSARAAASLVFEDAGQNYVVALGGLPYLLDSNKDNPLIRATADYKKEQVDQSAEPGEQSIQQWWIHSQSSFHLGAGQRYADTPTPQGGNIEALRYATSYGVNPWNEGQLTLLSQTTLGLASTTPTLLTADADGTSTQFLVASGSTLTRVTETVASGTPTYTTASVTWGGSGSILGLTTDGTNYYVANSVGVYKGILTGGSPGTGTSLVAWGSTASSAVLGYVKARVIAAVNLAAASNVYTLPVSGALPTPNYVHYNPAWKWTAITEGPDSIFISGFAGNKSEIYKFTLDTTGTMPTLSGASSAAVLPNSEIVLGMLGALGTTIGVTTTRGVRIGSFSGNGGGFQIGPLSVTSTHLGGGIGYNDKWYYAGGTHEDGTAGLYRVDTTQQVAIKQFSYTPDNRFGWARDARAADGSELPVAGQATAVATTIDGRAAFLVPGFGLYVAHPSKLVPSGTLTTSRIRYDTLDPKLFRFVRVRGEANNTTDSGTIVVAVSTDDTPAQTVGTLTLASSTDSGDLATDVARGVSAQVTLTLTRSVIDATVGPTAISYQLKGLPAQRRQRNIVLPLKIFDSELDNVGNTLGGDGTALSRLLALEALEQAGDIVTLQFIGALESQDLTELVVIDKIEYHMTSEPTDLQNWGGIAVVMCHTVT